MIITCFDILAETRYVTENQEFPVNKTSWLVQEIATKQRYCLSRTTLD